MNALPFVKHNDRQTGADELEADPARSGSPRLEALAADAGGREPGVEGVDPPERRGRSSVPVSSVIVSTTASIDSRPFGAAVCFSSRFSHSANSSSVSPHADAEQPPPTTLSHGESRVERDAPHVPGDHQQAGCPTRGGGCGSRPWSPTVSGPPAHLRADPCGRSCG